MQYRPTGNFLGHTDKTLNFNGLTLTDTVYSYQFVDWHYHENPHFALTIYGDFCEGTKRETFDCSVGTLLFHNTQEPHFNVKPPSITRGFQAEFSTDWGKKFGVDFSKFSGSLNIKNPSLKLLFYNIFKEAKTFDNFSNLAIDSLLLEALEGLRGIENLSKTTTPGWVKKIDEILHENFDKTLLLNELSDELNIHAAHLSRDFPRYFYCNFGEYVRKIKIEKALILLRQKHLSLTDISFACGFADQSHFIRTFKEFHGITPKLFRKLIQ